MKIKMTKGMHAKRILCLGLAAAMALTSVQISPITVEAKTVEGELTAGQTTDNGVDLSKKHNVLEAVYSAAELNQNFGVVDQIEKITFKASNTSTTAAKINVKVYMKNYSEGLSQSFVQFDSEDVVYTGTITVPASANKKDIEIKFAKKFDCDVQTVEGEDGKPVRVYANGVLLGVETELATELKDTENVTIKGYGDGALALGDDDTAVDLTRVYTQTVSAETPVAVTGNESKKPYLGVTAHTHAMRKYSAVAAVLNEDGTITDGYAEYYECNDKTDPEVCGGIYKEVDGKMVATTVDERVFEAHKAPVKTKITKLKTALDEKELGINLDAKYNAAIAAVDSAVYQEFDKDKKPMSKADNIAVLDKICSDFAKDLGTAEDNKVVANYERTVCRISSVLDADIDTAYNLYRNMTETQKVMVNPLLAQKMSDAVDLKMQVEKVSAAIDKLIDLDKFADDNTVEKNKDVFKTASNVTAVKTAWDLYDNLGKNITKVNEKYQNKTVEFKDDPEVEVSVSLLANDSDTVLNTTRLNNDKQVCDAIATIEALKTPVDLSSKKALEDAEAKYDACKNSYYHYEVYVYNIDKLTQANADFDKIAEGKGNIVDFLYVLSGIPENYKLANQNNSFVSDANGAYGVLSPSEKEVLQKSYGSQLTKYNLLLEVNEAVTKIRAVVVPGNSQISLEADNTSVAEARSACGKAGVAAHVNDTLLAHLEDNEAALAVIKDIEAIGDVTVNSKAKIEKARAGYDALKKFDEEETAKATESHTPSIHTVREALVSRTYSIKLVDAENTYAGLEVVALIDAIGKVEYTDACKARIDAARKAYNDLKPDVRAKVSNAAVLAQADTQYAAAKADDLAAKAVETMIDEIKTPLTGEAGEKITAAIRAYNKLTDAQAALIPTAKLNLLQDENVAVDVIVKIEEVASTAQTDKIQTAKNMYYGKAADEDGTGAVVGLTASQKAVLAENPFAEIDAALDVEAKIGAIGELTAITVDSKAAIKTAKDAYDVYMATYGAKEQYVKLNDDKVNALKEAVERLSSALVADLVQKVRAIGTVEYTEECAKKIAAAQDIFNGLTIEEKAVFTNKYATDYKTFEDAVSTYNVKAAEAIDAKIAALPEASLEAEAAVAAVYSEYNTLTVEQKALVKNAKALTDKIAAIESLKAEKADKDAADAAAKVIDAIGTVDGTEATDAKIAAAQEAFYGLTDAQKKLIADKKDALDKAVQEQAKKKAELLSEAAKKEEDAKAVAAAKEAIAAIGEVTKADEATKAKITKAQIAFYGLSEELQATLKDEKAILDAAYDKYTEIYIQNKINEVTPVAPTDVPTVTPTETPTVTPTKKPTATPTKKPTAAPTKKPSVKAPAKVTNVKVVNQKGKKVAVSWKKLPKVAGYQVQISTSKKFTKSTTKTYGIKKYTTVKKTVSKLSLKKKYYVRVRAYNKSGSTVKYGKYSLVKSVTVKK